MSSIRFPQPHIPLYNNHSIFLKPTNYAARKFNLSFKPLTKNHFGTLKIVRPKTLTIIQPQLHNLHLSVNRSEDMDVAGVEMKPKILFDKCRVTKNFRVYEEVLEGLKFGLLCGVKYNINNKILEHLGVLGCGAVVETYSELRLAREAGFHPTKCIFNGNGKSLEELLVADHEGVFVNVHNEIDLDYIVSAARTSGKKVNVLLPTSADISEPKFLDVVMANPDKMKLVGFHYQLGSTIPEVDMFVNSTFNMVRCIDQIRAQESEIDTIYIGGGFGTDYFHSGVIFPNLKDLIDPVREMLRSHDIKLIVDPGRGLLVKTCCLITRATTSDATKLILFDGSIQELPCDNYYDLELVHPTEPDVGFTAFVGSVSASVDSIEGSEFDGLVVHDAGPYCESMTATSHHRIRPTKYYVVEEDGSVSEIRDGEIVCNHMSPTIYLCSCTKTCGLHNIVLSNIYP